MLATKHTIIQFIPQRHPMVMVHDLVEADGDHAVTRFAIETGNVFVTNNTLAEPALVETIAQTAAAQVGYQCAQRNIAVPVGYIAAIKNLKIFLLPIVNTSITTTVKIINKVLDVTIIEGKIEQDGNVLCSCEMRIFVKTQS
jgi:3-hydroxyacyl-[acyl-carrier-protein] dehydratase